jgi:hypothetical protein
MLLRALFFLMPLMSLNAHAASTAMSAEALGAKAFLEDVLARRFAQELATKLDRTAFTVGAQLDLTELPKKVPTLDSLNQPPEPISDLMLGTLDPEELLKKYAGQDIKTSAEGFLRNYRIKTVNMAVGLKEDVEPEFKAEIETWLTARVTSEFGKTGKGVVAFIKSIPVKKEVTPPKDLLGWLSEFQSLAGQIVMAFALLFGVLMWKVLTSKTSAQSSNTGDTGPTINVGGASGEAAAERKAADAERKEQEEEERLSASRDIAGLSERLNALIPRLSKDFEAIMRAWCQSGDEGKFKLACFAEAVGQGLGKLPIPVDALPEISKVFARMSDVKLTEKRDALQKAYWDMLSVMNLGVETLTQPFGYLGGVNTGVLNQVLMDQNPKMKTIVSLFLPNDLRSRYLKSLSSDAKKELLESAARMSEIEASELKSMDSALAVKLKPQGNTETVPLDMTLGKLVSALSPMEEVTLLAQMQGPAIDSFKRSTPSIAFLGEWAEDKLKMLMSRVTPDELMALARVRPDLQERLVSLSPPLTAEMVGDELRMPDRTDDKTKNEWLTSLSKRINEMVSFQEVSLDTMFPAPSKGPTAVPPQDGANGSNQAA